MAAVPGAAREPGRAAGIVLAGTLVEVWHLLAAAAALGTAAAVALLLGRIGRGGRRGPREVSLPLNPSHHTYSPGSSGVRTDNVLQPFNRVSRIQ
jgi:hypothetical protein